MKDSHTDARSRSVSAFVVLQQRVGPVAGFGAGAF